MITIKSGVPGSGKTQSMVSEMLVMHRKAVKDPTKFRPIYTNIDGLALPHFPLPEPRKWMECPPESIIIVDEAQDWGFDALASQMSVPEHVKKLAQHRKDFSVDIWFITQHPKLLHMALRRQAGCHQHYERKFGMSRAFVLEWHACEDNLQNRKIAVLSRFEFKKAAMKAYKSAEVHTKQSFKLPLWVYLPLLIVPLGVWAAPVAFSNLSSVMTGKGLSSDKASVPALSDSKKTYQKDGTTYTVESVTTPAIPAPEPALLAPAVVLPQIAGCIVVLDRCGCFDLTGQKIAVEPAICLESAGINGTPKAIIEEEVKPRPFQPSDGEALAYMRQARTGH